MECAFAAIHDGTMRTAFVESWAAGIVNGVFTSTIFIPNGPYIDAGRFGMALEFLGPKGDGLDRLLPVDTDIKFTLDDVQRLHDLCDETTPVVSGVYIGKTSDGHHPLVYRLADDVTDPVNEPSRSMFEAIPAEKLTAGQGLVEAQAVGLGFCMYHRSFVEESIERWRATGGPWAERWITHDGVGVHVGEDLSFGTRLWEMGLTVLVDTDVQVPHMKNVTLVTAQIV